MVVVGGGWWWHSKYSLKLQGVDLLEIRMGGENNKNVLRMIEM